MANESKAVGGRGRWQRWSEQEGRAALDEFERSGQSAEEFAQKIGVSPQRLTYWKKRFAGKRTAAFVAVPLPVASRSSAVGASSWIEMDVDGIVLRVREDLEVEHLARIIHAVARRVRGC
jgi:transposase-like protein